MVSGQTRRSQNGDFGTAVSLSASKSKQSERFERKISVYRQGIAAPAQARRGCARPQGKRGQPAMLHSPPRMHPRPPLPNHSEGHGIETLHDSTGAATEARDDVHSASPRKKFL